MISKWFKPGEKGNRVFVLGLDGVPYSFITKLIQQGDMPEFAGLLETGSIHRMNSVIPTISSVAWASFATGKNPGKHNIYGFVDRVPNPFEIYIPVATKLQAKTMWEILSDAGKKVVVINVPMTYPPRPVNGIMISCFLATDLSKAVYPKEIYQKLKEIGYVIDVDPWKARASKDDLLTDLNHALEKRAEAMFHFMETQKWDFFMTHIMETDRLYHFLWKYMENNDSEYTPRFIQYHRKIDGIIGEIKRKLDSDTTFIILSDHGFCSIKKEVFLNYWMKENGWLKFKNSSPRGLNDMDSGTRAYSLIPGRIFVNLKGRETNGTVQSGKEYESVRNELIESLPSMSDPDTKDKIVEKVYRREELYSGPYFENAPDLVAVPYDGYDLKGNLDQNTLTGNSPLVGMHTFDDAMIYISGNSIKRQDFSIIDVMPTILEKMNMRIPEDVDGRSLLA
jgi:predicted AlkP superfamily phosphohydrolase/phosphomutase